MALRDRVRQRGFESSAQEAMVALLVAAAHLQRRLGDVCAAHSVTPDQYNVLRILRGADPAGLPRYEIVDRLIDRAPDVTRLLDRLERDGLVRRERSTEDRRLSISLITNAGMRLLQKLDPQVLAVHEQFTEPLSEPERRKLIRLCGKLID